MIKAKIRAKRFGGKPVLGPLSFDVAAGETLALVGPSGIGKSTLLRILAGLDTGFEGTVVRPEALAFVFQEPTLMPWRTVLQNLRIPHRRLTVEEAQLRLAEVGLEGKGGLFPGQLSLGQQRRVSLARAFSGTPSVLIMDEPFASLDEKTADEMLYLTEALISKVKPATLFVTHDAREADRLSDRILALRASPEGAIFDAMV